MASLRLSHQDTSVNMQHDLFWSLRDIDLRPNFDLHLSKSNHTSLESSLREKDDDAIADSLSLSIEKLFLKEYFTRNSYFTIFNLWRLNCWTEVTFDADVTPILLWEENCWNSFKRTYWELSNAFQRVVPARPEAHLRGLYLSNHLTDSLAVFFIRCALARKTLRFTNMGLYSRETAHEAQFLVRWRQHIHTRNEYSPHYGTRWAQWRVCER